MSTPERDRTLDWRVLSPTPLIRGVRLVWESGPVWSVLQLLVLVVQGLIPLATLYLTKEIVDAVTEAVAAGAGMDVFGQVVLLIGLAAGIAVIGVAMRTVGTLVSEVQSLKLSDRVHDVLQAQSVRVDLEYYESSEYHDTLHRAQEEAPYRPARIVAEVARVGQSALSLIAVTGLLFTFHWGLAAALFTAAIPGVFIRIRYSNRLYRWARSRTSAQRKARYLNRLLTGGDFAKEVRLFGLGETLRTWYSDLRTTVRTERLALITRRSLLELVAQAVALGAVFGSFAFVARGALAGDITIGDLVMYFAAFQRAQDFFASMLGGLAGLYENNLFLSDLETFLGLQPRVTEPAEPKPFPRPIHRGIVFDDVSFRYPGAAAAVLESIDLEIRPGEHVALVGENGSGKTTLVKLLCRLYDPTAGAIRVDGIDYRDIAALDLRREIGIVFQDYARYHLAARENIRFGNVDIAADDPRIVAAAERTGADTVIRGLVSGYDTVLGRQFEDGAELSIGEWQKVAIARAFLREGQIIVLDEPTASLDARAEAEVFERFHELSHGRTAILISHRLSTVRMVDRIFVLADGRIAETGTHDELIRRRGRYAQLFELQARNYR
jgi:ATP-binding cassette subfamily B protein